jgi:hypothetical protein
VVAVSLDRIIRWVDITAPLVSVWHPERFLVVNMTDHCQDIYQPVGEDRR